MMWLFLLTGCLSLDGFLFRGVHCSDVTEQTCTEGGEWDRLCLSCEDEYLFDVDYPWAEGFLDEGQEIPAVPESEVLDLPTSDGMGTLSAVWVPAQGLDTGEVPTTIVYNHGNYASIEHYMPRARILAALGYDVLIWDYRGYGKTSIEDYPTDPAVFWADAQVAFDEAASRAAGPVVVYGLSLGGLPAVEQALRNEPCALVLEAPMTSIEQVTETTTAVSLPDSMLTSGGWNNLDKIGDWSGPLLTMSGTEDHTFPTVEVRRLHEAAGSTLEEFWEVEGVGHGVTPPGVPDIGLSIYGDRLADFLSTAACR